MGDCLYFLMSQCVVLGRTGQKVTFCPLGFLLCQVSMCGLGADHTLSSPECLWHSLLTCLAALSEGTLWGVGTLTLSEARSPQLRRTRVLFLLPPYQSQMLLLSDRNVSLIWA